MCKYYVPKAVMIMIIHCNFLMFNFSFFFFLVGLFVMTGMHKGCKGKTKPESTAGPDNN